MQKGAGDVESTEYAIYPVHNGRFGHVTARHDAGELRRQPTSGGNP
jgi:hypothetical protein